MAGQHVSPNRSRPTRLPTNYEKEVGHTSHFKKKTWNKKFSPITLRPSQVSDVIKFLTGSSCSETTDCKSTAHVRKDYIWVAAIQLPTLLGGRISGFLAVTLSNLTI